MPNLMPFAIPKKPDTVPATRLLVLLFTAFIMFCGSSQAQSSRLFDSDEVLEFTISCDMKALMQDRGDDPQYHKATITSVEDGPNIEVSLKIKARGNFRKMPSNCRYPPLHLNFSKSGTPKESIFYGQDKTKLVTPCVAHQYVVNEYLVYKLYNLLTPKSFRARLVKLTFHDLNKDKQSDQYFGILLEEEKQMAKRNNCIAIKTKRQDPRTTAREDFLRMAVFEYMIGNTDWSVEYLQNIKLLADDKKSIRRTVPYDFDHAGIVKAPYAKPAQALRLNSTRTRRYRGYCIENMEAFAPVFEQFNQLQEEFYALYTDNPYISEGYKKQTLKYLDDFYDTINDPKKARAAFTYPCDPHGTGNVIIKGLNKD
jgi:hypothetical protein